MKMVSVGQKQSTTEEWRQDQSCLFRRGYYENKGHNSSLNVFDDGVVLLRLLFGLVHCPYVLQSQRFEGWLFARLLGDDEGRAIPRNVVVAKHGDDGYSPNNRSQ
jgi:hypothetical protein